MPLLSFFHLLCSASTFAPFSTSFSPEPVYKRDLIRTDLLLNLSTFPIQAPTFASRALSIGSRALNVGYHGLISGIQALIFTF
ncbi:hypothetical protein HQ43_06485 [Porphyromonas canoris]|uniref:Secreted protein n=1 Tax=Porphyromonas canoris TaxID=36875 RepID=A0ABR4XK17_9PORP|nr:hypothetical protein HQ43_06485 [Porphyromonas canoris]